MFMGEYQHNLDAKGRIFVPSRLRESLGEPFVLTKGLERCLFAFPALEWQLLGEKLRKLSFTSRDARAFSRFFFAGASECEIDKQGRVLIPANLREHANLTKEAVIIGVSTRVEIWAAATWDKYKNETAASYEDIAEKIFDVELEIGDVDDS